MSRTQSDLLTEIAMGGLCGDMRRETDTSDLSCEGSPSEYSAHLCSNPGVQSCEDSKVCLTLLVLRREYRIRVSVCLGRRAESIVADA